jgi:hypothetical protein
MKATLSLITLVLISTIGADLALAESPQTSALEVRFGFYQPDIDSEFGGNGPLSRTFDDDSMFTFGLEFDYQLLRGFGSLGIYTAFNYGYIEGSGLLQDGTASSDTTSFSMLPISVGAVYRFDVLAVRWDIPLVFSFKFGPEYAIWWMRDGLEEISTFTSAEGKEMEAIGGTYGLSGAIGLHILLDIFESHTAKIFDNEMGINNSYLFIEYGLHWLNDFGSDSSLDLSDTGVVFGLAFEM